MSNIRYLRTFIAVARHGSFSAAAERVALTQAAVSVQMQTLESDLKHALFDRSGRIVVLTSTGRAMLPRAEQLVALYDEMRALGAEASEVIGSVAIGGVVSVMGVLAATVASLKVAHPRLDVRLITARSLELARQVESSEIDAAILVEAQGKIAASLAWAPLYTEPLALLASKMTGNVSASELIRTRPFLRFERTQRTGVLIDRALRKQRLVVNEFLELSSIEAIVELVRQNVGIAIVPLLRNCNWTRDTALRVLPLAQGVPHRAIGMLERKAHDRYVLTSAIRQRILEGMT
ncbi:LysR family transcriptional regulator [Paraburkholderia sartisoli]|uniref:DNA-binding transcriptional regulator, LysR family n=1 Tax=Paraburkholderia sartisoli TaxID=83784 RepID=A0A1H4FKG9_9BURK|nr:LysR family transcriptional regulator [Paraburkholderia sartisoli]SEA96982.1 DNA-binding transcriptional regulator, LysR family [Paraburkholderia sartisoli]